MSLTILMADDHKKQIEDARDVLLGLGHDVHDVYKYDEAEKLARENAFDIAVIDLGWYDDDYLKSIGKTKNQRADAGYALVDLVKEHNPGAVRIIYTAHANEKKVIQTAAFKGALCIQKIPETDPDSIHGREYLEYVVTTIAVILASGKELQGRVSSDEKKYRRVLTIVVSMLIVTFALFVAAWMLTGQLNVVVYAFGASTFTTLVIFLALRILNRSDVETLGGFWKMLFHQSSNSSSSSP